MTALTITPSVETLAWTLVHFLWQGAALGVIVFLWLRIGRPSAQARYLGGVVALAALLAAPVATFMRLGTAPDLPASSGMVAATEARDPAIDLGTGTPAPVSVPASPTDAPDAGLTAREVAAATVVVGWAAGVLLLSLRLAGGWILAQRLAARAARPATAEISALAAGVSQRLGLTRAVRVIESGAVSVPMLVGWMKPVVLLPAAALSGLSPEQIEALIAHELAHVRRHDYILNILQSIVETLLFYHPAVWFVSRQIRQAREECCDDLAVGVCDRVVYVRALADLAGLAQAPRIALAATDGCLLRRVQRLLGQPQGDRGPGAAWLGILSMALVVGGVMPTAVDSFGSESTDAAQAAVGGVAGGRAGGVEAGVIGGIAGGVAGGVRGGVEAGRVGGVAGGQQEQQRRTEEDTRRIRQEADRQLRQGLTNPGDVRELEARIAAIEQQLAGVRSPRPGAADGSERGARSTAQLEARALRARAELDAARTEYERARQLFDVGLLSPPGIQEAQNRLAAAEREVAAATIEVQVTAEETAMRDSLDARRARLQAESAVRQAELELTALRESLDTIKQRLEVGTAPRESLVEAETRVASAEQRLVAARTEFELTLEEIALQQGRTNALRRLVSEMEEQHARYALTSGDKAPAARVDDGVLSQPGDILSIEISGEPDLPRNYRIDTNGTIRLPLVGALKVAGMTASQARGAIAAALTERQLGEGKAVTVTLHRPK